MLEVAEVTVPRIETDFPAVIFGIVTPLAILIWSVVVLLLDSETVNF